MYPNKGQSNKYLCNRSCIYVFHCMKREALVIYVRGILSSLSIYISIPFDWLSSGVNHLNDECSYVSVCMVTWMNDLLCSHVLDILRIVFPNGNIRTHLSYKCSDFSDGIFSSDSSKFIGSNNVSLSRNEYRLNANIQQMRHQISLLC